MADSSTRLRYLLQQYADNACTHAELQELFRLINVEGEARLSEAAEMLNQEPSADFSALDNEELDVLFERILATEKKGIFWRQRLFKVAAAVVICSLSALWWFSRPLKSDKVAALSATKNDVVPGTNKAILTLSSGAHILLSGKSKGLLGRQGNIALIATDSGELSYNKSAAPQVAALYNTVSTPRGGQYRLTLADGTKVWLNAASSIRYPADFIGDSRQVEVTGEAYFEVAHDATKPFRVHVLLSRGVDGGTVEVLGTHFNINAYSDEPTIKTTLLEGRVKVTDRKTQVFLAPGQQSLLQPEQGTIHVQIANADQAVAWKNGLFQFEHADIKEVMRQLSRWYDVEVKFEKAGSNNDKFGGTIIRDAPLSEVLHTLEQSLVHFKLEGRTLTVLD